MANADMAGAADAPEDAPVVSIEHLTVAFPMDATVITAVNDVSLTVPRRAVTALVGESGSGKSTLASAILRAVPPPGEIRGGRILFEGKDVLGLGDRDLQAFRWARAAMVFQAAQNSLNPVMTIRDTFLETAASHGRVQSAAVTVRAWELLDYVRLDPQKVWEAYPHELSGGMKQRAMLALSLLLEPALIVLDEPTTALDVITQEAIFDILLAVHQDLGTAMLLLSHDIGVVARAADWVGVMYAGRLVEEGSVFDVFDNPRHPYTRGLIDAAPSLLKPPESLHSIPGSPPNLAQLPSGCAFHPRCPAADAECRTIRPPLVRFADGRAVACHHPAPAAPITEQVVGR